jgi:hypothetical protein
MPGRRTRAPAPPRGGPHSRRQPTAASRSSGVHGFGRKRTRSSARAASFSTNPLLSTTRTSGRMRLQLADHLVAAQLRHRQVDQHRRRSRPHASRTLLDRLAPVSGHAHACSPRARAPCGPPCAPPPRRRRPAPAPSPSRGRIASSAAAGTARAASAHGSSTVKQRPAAARLALDADRPAMPAEDPQHRRQPQPAPRELGREERIEDARPRLRVESPARRPLTRAGTRSGPPAAARRRSWSPAARGPPAPSTCAR